MARTTREVIYYDVPAGFPAMSMPIVDGMRFGNTDIVLADATEDDLYELAVLNATAFPEVWWSKHEPLATRPDAETRYQRGAKRLLPFLHMPGTRMIVAKVASSGEVVGGAGWHEPQTEPIWPTAYADMGDIEVPPNFKPCSYRYDLVDALGMKEKLGWTQDEVDEMWSSIDLRTWQDEFINDYDKIRLEEMGSTPHWYLAPLFVKEQFRGRGVGGMLLDWALMQADATTPPTPVFLEALPNARPVYYSKGFKPVQRETGGKTALIRIGPPQKDV